MRTVKLQFDDEDYRRLKHSAIDADLTLPAYLMERIISSPALVEPEKALTPKPNSVVNPDGTLEVESQGKIFSGEDPLPADSEVESIEDMLAALESSGSE